MQEAREALANHPKCGAHSRTTGHPCKNASMKNGRCRMHGGRSTGRPATHGQRTKKSNQRRQQLIILLKILNDLPRILVKDKSKEINLD